MSSMDWTDERFGQRLWTARQQRRARGQEVKRQRRRAMRSLARMALAVSLVALGVLALEIGQKVVVVMQHAQVADFVRLS